MTFGEGSSQRTEAITFDVVDISYPYNAIFSFSTIIKFGAVIHQTYLCQKHPTARGVITILNNQKEACRCKDNEACATKNVHAIKATEDKEEGEPKPSKPDEAYKPEGVAPAEHTKKVPLCEDVPDRTVIICKGLSLLPLVAFFLRTIAPNRCYSGDAPLWAWRRRHSPSRPPPPAALFVLGRPIQIGGPTTDPTRVNRVLPDNCGHFANKPLSFLLINPQSTPIQNKFCFNLFSYKKAPMFPKIEPAIQA